MSRLPFYEKRLRTHLKGTLGEDASCPEDVLCKLS